MGKGEIACYKQFLLFPQCFQKACFPEVSKGVIVWEWVKIVKCWSKFDANILDNTRDIQPIPRQRHILMPLGNKLFENTVGKGEITRNDQFLLFQQCFLPIWITFCHFRQI